MSQLKKKKGNLILKPAKLVQKANNFKGYLQIFWTAMSYCETVFSDFGT